MNDQQEILLFLRDNNPAILYPNMWDVLGGHMEEDETPEGCIIREMKEELGLDLKGFGLFSVTEFPDKVEHTFWKHMNLDLENVTLTEGQRLKWFTQQEVARIQLADGFGHIVGDFFKKKPFEGSLDRL